MSRRRSAAVWGLFAIPLLFLALFYFYPLARIFLLSFFPGGDWEPAALADLIGSRVYGGILWFTIWQAALSTILTLLLALPCASLFARYRFPGKDFLKAAMTIPFVLPTVVVAAAFKALLGDNGLVNGLLMSWLDVPQPVIHIEQSVVFFLLAHVFYNYALVVRIVGSFWEGLDTSLGDAARLLGASPGKIFRSITLPLLLPAIGSAALLVFIFCFTSFGVILILGGPGYATLEVEIYRQAVQLFNLPMAAALSLIQIVVNLLLMWLHARLSGAAQTSFFSDASTAALAAPCSLGQYCLVIANLGFMLVLLLAPLLALVVRSLYGEDGFTLGYYTALFAQDQRSVFFVEPILAVRNSLAFAGFAMTIAVVLGLLAATFLASAAGRGRSLWDAVIMLPLATSAVTLGFGYIISLGRPPLNLRDSLVIVPIAHCLVALPFVVRCILPTLRRIPASLREAAAMLGASPMRVWRQVDLPLSAGAIVVAAVFAFSISMGEFGASAFVARPYMPTMPVAIFRFLGQPGELNYGQAMAMSTILMAVTGLAFWLMAKIDAGRRIVGQGRWGRGR